MLQYLLKSTVSLLFPKLCLSCAHSLADDNAYICLFCELKLPETDYWTVKENAFLHRFAYDERIEAAAALYFYTKTSAVQHLIHKIKYKDQRTPALQLGRLLGDKINGSDFFKNIDMIVPVPMHPRKERERGYNQAMILAQGISEKTGWRIDNKNILKKKKYSTVQAHSNYSERLRNVSESYICTGGEKCYQKNILIVDDVATTCATLQACVDAIIEKQPDCKLFIVTLAFTSFV